MEATERRYKLMNILYRRGHETIANLSEEFGVSERTIRRDIEILSLFQPIYTKSGRYGGGVYVTADNTENGTYFGGNEIMALYRMADFIESSSEISEYEKTMLHNFISKYIKHLLKGIEK